jgi:hypothetical protein
MADWDQTAGTRGKSATPPVPSPDGNNERHRGAGAPYGNTVSSQAHSLFEGLMGFEMLLLAVFMPATLNEKAAPHAPGSEQLSSDQNLPATDAVDSERRRLRFRKSRTSAGSKRTKRPRCRWGRPKTIFSVVWL